MITFVSVQIASPEAESLENRIKRVDHLLDDLYESGSRPVQIILPEIWTSGFFSFDCYKRDAQAAMGHVYDMLSSKARKLGSYIHTGSFVEEDKGNYYNTSLLLSPNGNIAAKYRKIHLFGYQSRESEILTPGSGIIVTDTDYGRVGLATCYDLRFPELFRAMVDQGARFFLITSAWPMERLSHWKLFQQVRALENQSWLISCNAAGIQRGQRLAGNSGVIDPRGQILQMGSDKEEMVTANIDPEEADRYRSAFPALKDRRLGGAYQVGFK